MKHVIESKYVSKMTNIRYTNKYNTCILDVDTTNITAKRIENDIETVIPLPPVDGRIKMDVNGNLSITTQYLNIVSVCPELCNEGSLVVISSAGDYFIVEYDGIIALDVPKYFMFTITRVSVNANGNYKVYGKNLVTKKKETYYLSRNKLKTKVSSWR